MKRILPFLLLFFTAAFAFAEIPADYYPRTIFFDDFSGTEFGKRWGHFKSASVVKDGVLVGITPPNSDHNAVDCIKFDPERDLEVSVKFRFVSEKAKGFSVALNDKDYKDSHAGHICSIIITPKSLTLSDGKTGNFRNDLYEKKDAPGGLSDEDKAYIRTKSKLFPVQWTLQDWHTLIIRTKADEIEARLDGKIVGSFKSEGVAHETKNYVSLQTNQVDVQYDDFSIKGVAKR